MTDTRFVTGGGPGPPPTDAPTPARRALKVLGAIVAPAALVSALLYFYGFIHAYAFFGRFGVDYTLMGLSTTDYLVRSQDGLFVPLVGVGVAGLVGLWVGRCLPTWVLRSVQRSTRRVVAPAAVGVAVALLVVAGAGVVNPASFAGTAGVPGISLTVAVLLFTAAGRGPRRRRPAPTPTAVAEWLAVFVLVSGGLFWATTDYSQAVGTRRAGQLIAALPTWPDAVVYSAKSLNLMLPGVREQRCRNADGAYAFRYDGLKLVMQSGGQLFLLPARWVDGAGSAVVLPRTDALRLEFTGAGQSAAGRC